MTISGVIRVAVAELYRELMPEPEPVALVLATVEPVAVAEPRPAPTYLERFGCDGDC